MQRNPKNQYVLLLTLQAWWEKLSDSHIGVGVPSVSSCTFAFAAAMDIANRNGYFRMGRYIQGVWEAHKKEKKRKYSSFGPAYNQLYLQEKKDRGDFCASYLEAIHKSRWGFQASKSLLKSLCSSAPSAWERVQNGSFQPWIVRLQQQSYHHT